MVTRIILDTDPGIDDALALLFALRRPGIAVEAVTTVFGNADIDTTTTNAIRLLDLFGRPDIPVAQGAGRSLTRPFVRKANHIHGSDGLGEVALPPASRRPLDEPASELLIRLARANPGALTLVPVGPLTNVALALLRAPDIAPLFERIVVMGGSLHHPGIPGIPSPMADANFWNDPEAARIVLQSGARVEVIGMDVTMLTLFTPAMMKDLEAAGNDATRATMAMSRFYFEAYRRQYPEIAGCALHDPLAVAVAEDPSLVTMEPMACDVECLGEITRGQLIADRRRTAIPRTANASVALDVDAPRFIARFLGALKTA